jgi:acetylornithine/N-succinyldiaminopimelate aminotransferase
VLGDPALLASVRELGERLRDGLAALPGTADVRGRGLMVAFETDDAPGLVRRALLEQRLVLNATGPGTVRLLPPLVVTADEIDDALARVGRLLATVNA